MKKGTKRKKVNSVSVPACIPRQSLAAHARLIAAAPELFALLEPITRAPFGQLGNVKGYFIADDTMRNARALVASLVDPETYVARQRAKEEQAQAFTSDALGATLTEAEETRRGALLCAVLTLRSDSSKGERYHTQWGSKTPLGIFRTVSRIVLDGK